jgi:hypothetical protein
VSFRHPIEDFEHHPAGQKGCDLTGTVVRRGDLHDVRTDDVGFTSDPTYGIEQLT